MTTAIYVEGAERMLIQARIIKGSLYVRFADDREGKIPLAELSLKDNAREVSLPTPFGIELTLENGATEEIPWDYIRHFIDPAYKKREKAHVKRGQQKLGDRLQMLRTRAKLSQEELAEKSGVGRVTIARIELGRQSPKYATLLLLAAGLGISVERLLVS